MFQRNSRRNTTAEDTSQCRSDNDSENGTVTVKLPTNISLRAKEKSAIYRLLVDPDFEHRVYQMATASAICLMMVGTSVLFFGYPTDSVSYQTVQLPTIDTNATDPEKDSRTVRRNDNLAAVFPPTNSQQAAISGADVSSYPIQIITAIPAEIEQPMPIHFELPEDLSYTVVIVQTEKSGLYQIETQKIGNNRYSATIPATLLSPGLYTMRFFISYPNKPVRVFNSRTFRVGQERSTIKLPSLPNDNLGEREVQEIVQNTQNAPRVPNQAPFAINPPLRTTLTGQVALTVSGAQDLDFVELYAQPVGTKESEFVVLGTRYLTVWRLAFNTAILPNGTYDFFARSKRDGVVVRTPSIRLQLLNDRVVAADRYKNWPKTGLANTGETRLQLQETDAVDETKPKLPSEYLRESAEREARALLEERVLATQDTLRAYAEALRNGDQASINAAEAALTEYRKSIATVAIQSSRTGDIADRIDVALSEKIKDLQQRVYQFEKVRASVSEPGLFIDTDKDGLHDQVELYLYKTDPNKIDTDGDGIDDKTEIRQGTNPLNHDSAAVIRFESPKNTSELTRADLLMIESVVPKVESVTGEFATSTDNSTTTAIEESSISRTSILGTALPNSIVTLYIFSTPTVVTIETDADGSFVYNFDSELEDGTHEVYVAVTDSAGRIVAQSNPFSFLISDAEAISPVGAATGEIVVTETLDKKAQSAYGQTIGIGILALGIILFMLGVFLRPKEEVLYRQ